MDLTSIIQTGFSNAQLLCIIASLISGLISIILFVKKQPAYSLFFLLLSGVILRLFAAGIDPFLNTWDEQFHALVAKNLMNNPFKPVLISNPVLDYNFQEWKENHIWLHKQPWFLWQIALFFKLFGTTEFVLRLPTAIMMSIMILLVYRIGKLVSTPSIAWYSTFIYTYSFFLLNFVSGQSFTDHNDAAFIFYVTMSIWSFLEFYHTEKKYWLLLTGLFAGIAILNKWMVGLLVYSGWFISILVAQPRNEWKLQFKNLGKALLITVLVALPWQIFILFAYPVESRYEFGYNSLHFFQALEGHSETRFYYFYLLAQQYGGFIIYFIILPGLFFFFKSMNSRFVKIALLTFLIMVYVFFTIAETKMHMFTMVVSFILFLGLGAFLDYLVEHIRPYLSSFLFQPMVVVFLGFIGYLNLDINRIDDWHSEKQTFWKTKRINGIIDKQVATRFASNDLVFLNAGGLNSTMLMFYSGKTAYGRYPDYTQYLELKKKGIKMAVFSDTNLPDYLKKDQEVRKIYIRPFYY